MISEGRFEDIAATRTKPPAPRTAVRSRGDAGPVWSKAQVLYDLDPEGRITS